MEAMFFWRMLHIIQSELPVNTSPIKEPEDKKYAK
jgi:hypothetical protein